MSQYIRCNGCGTELTGLPVNHAAGHKERYVHGERAEGSEHGLSPLPDSDFDWCRECALTAFTAVRDAGRGSA